MITTLAPQCCASSSMPSESTFPFGYLCLFDLNASDFRLAEETSSTCATTQLNGSISLPSHFQGMRPSLLACATTLSTRWSFRNIPTRITIGRVRSCVPPLTTEKRLFAQSDQDQSVSGYLLRRYYEASCLSDPTLWRLSAPHCDELVARGCDDSTQ